MSDTMNEQDRARLNERLACVRWLASVQAEQLEESVLEIASITEKLGFSSDTVKSIREMASVIAIIKKFNKESEEG